MRRLTSITLAFGLLVASLSAPVVVSAASAVATPPTRNLVSNPGLTTDATSWTLSRRATYDAGSLRIAATDTTAWEGATSTPFGLDGRRTAKVTVSALAKLHGVTQGATIDNQAKVYIAFVNATGARTWQGIRLQGTQDWRTESATYDVPPGTVSAFLSIALDRAVGTVWFDDLSVTAAAPVNLAPNPGFETVSTDPNCPATFWCTPYLSQTYKVDTEVFQAGARAMRIDAVPGKKVGGFITSIVDQSSWPLVTIGADVKLGNLTAADYTDTPGGLRLSLNFSYVNEAGATVYTGSSVMGGIMVGTRDWGRVGATFRLPPKTKRVQVIPEVRNATGSAWIDNVSITPESSWLVPDNLGKGAAAGSEVVYHTTVTNRRTVADSIDLALDQSSLLPATANVEPAVTGVLAPGQSARVKVTVAVPAGTAAGSLRQVRLVATPSGATDLRQVAWFDTTVAVPGERAAQPQVYNTPAELDALRKRVAEQGWASDAFAKVVKTEAEGWLARPLDQTMSHGAWSGDYKCPGTNTALQFDFSKPTEHRCPIDGKVYTGEPYNSAWVEIWHNNAASGASDLALTYQLLPASDPSRLKYAEKARDVLLYYADQFLSVPRNGLYGRVHYQSLDEAVSAIGLIDAYDLIRATLSPADQVAIEQNLLRPLAELLMEIPTSTSNFQAWHDAAIYGIGSVLNEPAYREYALNNVSDGVEFLLDNAAMKDGWWWEGSASYHVYALQALTNLVMAARNHPDGHDYTQDPRFKKMYSSMLPYMYPDLTVPAAGDGGNWGRRFGPNFTMFAEWAYGNYHDPDYAASLDYAYTNLKQPRTDRWALRYGAERIPPGAGLRVASRNHASLGESTMISGQPVNLAPNPGFEDASYWNLAGATWELARVFDGERAAKVVGDTSRWRGLHQDVPLDGSRISAVRLSAMAAGSPGRISLTFLDGAGAVAGTSGKASAGGDWASYDVTVGVPVRTRAVRISLGLDRAAGTTWFDDVDLWVNDLVVDGGFEDGGEGWTKSGAAKIDPLGYRGKSAARLTTSSSWTKEVPLDGADVSKLELSAKVRAVAVGPGSARMELAFVNKDGVETAFNKPLNGSFGWTGKSIAADVPRDTVKVRIGLVADRASGVAWFDDVALSFSQGVDAFQADYLRLDYGIPGGTHGHADKLHLDIVGAGGLQSTDLGQVYGASNSDLTNNWYRETVSHNTVVVDGISQDRSARGELAYFGTTPRLQVTDALAKGAYASLPSAADVTLRRRLLMTDNYALDVFDATGSKPHTYDQSWHAGGSLAIGNVLMKPAECPGPPCVLNPNDKDNGYHRLTNVAQGNSADGQWTAAWTDGQSVLRLTGLEPRATDLLHETGPGTASTGTAIPFVLARRPDTASTRYTTLLETYRVGSGSPVSSVRRLSDGHTRVDLTNGTRDDLLYDATGYALVREKGGLRSIDLLDRSSVALDGKTLVTGPADLEKASIVYNGTTVHVDVRRSTTTPTQLTLHAPGATRVYLNNKPVPFTTTANGGIRLTV